jgi:hypothetical protein
MSRDAKRPVGTWFELPLDDGVHFALGLLVGRPIPKVTEFAFFGPWNRPVTIDDVVGLRPGDEVRLVGLPTHACTEKLVTARGWVDLGVHPAVNTQDWYELGDRLIPNAFVQRDLTLALVEGWKPAHPTRPEQASSWWYWPAGKEWFEGVPRGDLSALEAVFAEVLASERVGREASMVAFGAVELAARTYVLGWLYTSRRWSMPDIELGWTERVTLFLAEVPEAQHRDGALMRELRDRGRLVLDWLWERSLWVEELRAGDSAVWDVFERRTSALREWFELKWLLPPTFAEVLDNAMGAFERTFVTGSIDDDDDGDDGVFVPQVVPVGVDGLTRLGVMSWFQLDDVSDWSAGALQRDGWLAVMAGLDRALDDGVGGVLDGGVGLAAADVVARLVSGGESGFDRTVGGVVEERVAAWVAANSGRDVDAGTVDKARRVVALMRRGELAEEIDGMNDERRAAWELLLSSIERRLDLRGQRQ